jgi:FMN phosphatase YigB (HAD superfamily)
MIKAILFDFGGTLFNFKPSNYTLLASVARGHGKDILDSDPLLSIAFQNQEDLALKLFQERKDFNVCSLTDEDWFMLDQILLETL